MQGPHLKHNAVFTFTPQLSVSKALMQGNGLHFPHLFKWISVKQFRLNGLLWGTSEIFHSRDLNH